MVGKGATAELLVGSSLYRVASIIQSASVPSQIPDVYRIMSAYTSLLVGGAKTTSEGTATKAVDHSLHSGNRRPSGNPIPQGT